MTRRGLAILLGAAGLALGGGAAVMLRPMPKAAAEPPNFLAVGALLVPLIDRQGAMVRFVTVEVELDVVPGEEEAVKLRLPFLLDAVNGEITRAPLATGPDGTIPDLDRLRAIIAEKSRSQLGAKRVRRVAIVSARPA